MAQRERSEIKRELEYKGFKNRGGDHEFYIYYTLSGKKTVIKTKISRGTGYKVYSDSLLAAMAKQCKLTKGKFLDLVDCTLNRDEYEKILSTSNPNPLI